LKFTTRAQYGLQIMVDLAQNYARGEPIPLFQVAERQGLSEGYLEQLIIYLRKGSLVRSVRGVQGGYLLIGEPARITAGEIVRRLEGPLTLTGYINEDNQKLCARAETCAMRVMWERIGELVANVLDSITLADLCKGTEKMRLPKKDDRYCV